ncbi:MAG TPA: molybdate ABC transporter substrate-binding protein [Cellvibrio sp.]|nr:molybdate ABC transporter substrate-binding protein [Cellvibrio sp.]
MMHEIINLRDFGARFVLGYAGKSLTAFVLVLACSLAQAAELKLYAAASLTDALTELSTQYQKSHPQLAIKKSFAGSATLAKQIENGAAADIFISADKDWADYLQTRGLLRNDSRKKLLANDLVLIAPVDSDVKVSLDAEFDFAHSFNGRLCTGDTASVPVGKYAKQSLIHYGWWSAVESRLVGTEDVRTALAFVERAECSLGIVYKTDAQLSRKVKIVATFPANSHAAIEYPGALTKNAGAEAAAYWSFLQSDEARAVFARYGFSPIN